MAAAKTLWKRIKQYNPETRQVIYLVAFDASYPTGGEELDFTSDFRTIDSVVVEANSSGYLIAPNIATREAKYKTAKCDLQAFRQTAATGALVEVPATTDLSALLAYVIVTGSPF